MQIEIKLEEACEEPKVVIVTRRMTEEVKEILERLSETQPAVIAGFRGDTAEILEPSGVYRVFASEGKVLAETDQGSYTLRLRLYEAEQKLERYHFVRISNSELVNMKKIQRFDLSFTGTICVLLSNGAVTYVSRRYMNKIKQVLGL